MRILVCGGRDFNDAAIVFAALDEHAASAECICHGGAPGADSLAGEWAQNRGIECRVFHADWERHGRAAGPIRNQQMLTEFAPTLVVAFPGGRGTNDMIFKAARADVPVRLIKGAHP